MSVGKRVKEETPNKHEVKRICFHEESHESQGSSSRNPGAVSTDDGFDALGFPPLKQLSHDSAPFSMAVLGLDVAHEPVNTNARARVPEQAISISLVSLAN